MEPLKSITINGQTLPVRNFKGQRVVTFKDVAMLHQCKENNLRANFSRNKKHFVKDVDYFVETFKNPDFNNLSLSKIFFTESGYLMIIKSLRDELSRLVQRELINTYFRNFREINNSLYSILSRDHKRVLFYRIVKGLTQAETIKVLDFSKKRLYKVEKDLKNAGINIPHQHRDESFLKTGGNYA